MFLKSQGLPCFGVFVKVGGPNLCDLSLLNHRDAIVGDAGLSLFQHLPEVVPWNNKTGRTTPG